MARIEISSGKKYYFTNEKISIEVSLLSKVPIKVNTFKIFVKGYKKIRAEEKRAPLLNIEDDVVFFEYLCVEDKEISSGLYVYPVYFYLNKASPSTIFKRKINELACDIVQSYVVKVSLNGSVDVEEEFKLNILGVTNDLEHVDCRLKLRKFLFFSKYYFYRILQNKEFYFAGDSLDVKVYSTIDKQKNVINGVKMSLFEVVKVFKNGLTIARSRNIGNNEISGSLDSYNLSLKLPNHLSSTSVDREYEISYILYVTLVLKKGKPCQIRKPIYIHKICLKIENLEEFCTFEALYQQEIFLELI